MDNNVGITYCAGNLTTEMNGKLLTRMKKRMKKAGPRTREFLGELMGTTVLIVSYIIIVIVE